MGNSYQSTSIQSTANITNISNILTQNQNVVESTVITLQSQTIVINGNVDCTQFTIINASSITVVITGQMNAQTANSVSNYIDSSIQNSLSQSTSVVTELLGVYGGNEQIADVSNAVNEFCGTYITTQNLQTIMSDVRASQVQSITINGNITGALCNFENTITVAVAATAILTAVTQNLLSNSLTANFANAVSQYYMADAKGLNSLVSSVLTALLLPLIIGAVVIGIIIIIVVIFKVISSKNHAKVVQQAKTLGIPIPNPKAPLPVVPAVPAVPAIPAAVPPISPVSFA
jgi:hypothetical protein